MPSRFDRDAEVVEVPLERLKQSVLCQQGLNHDLDLVGKFRRDADVWPQTAEISGSLASISHRSLVRPRGEPTGIRAFRTRRLRGAAHGGRRKGEDDKGKAGTRNGLSQNGYG